MDKNCDKNQDSDRHPGWDYDYDRHADTSSIPMLMDPDRMPRIETDEDLYRHWRAAMGPLGFAAPALWLGIITDEGYMERCLQKIEQIPLHPDETVDRVMELCKRIVAVYAEAGEQASIAMLLTRPGTATLTAADRAWARAVNDAAHHHGLHFQTLHIATDVALRPITPDDFLK